MTVLLNTILAEAVQASGLKWSFMPKVHMMLEDVSVVWPCFWRHVFASVSMGSLSIGLAFWSQVDDVIGMYNGRVG